MQYAVVNVNAARVLASVVKKNPLTTIVDLEMPKFSPEEMVDLMIRGTSIHKLYYEYEQKGFTHEGRIKRHNIKHQVVFC